MILQDAVDNGLRKRYIFVEIVARAKPWLVGKAGLTIQSWLSSKAMG